jgi:hypothetical protein
MAGCAGKIMNRLSTTFAMVTLAVAAYPYGSGSAQTMATQDTAVTPAPVTPVAPRFIPFGTGERMDYQVKFGAFSVGKGRMEMMGIEQLRGTPVWRAELFVEGGLSIFYSLKSTYTTWFDTSTLFSLRYTRDQIERGRVRNRIFDIYPERSVFKQRIVPDTLPEMPSVPDPLDEFSFFYFIRTTPMEVGQTYTYMRHFRQDRNPVVIKVLRKETISVPLGEFDAIVIQPNIKAGGVFGDDGEALVWLSDDRLRLVLKIESKVSAIGSLHLNLTNYTPPKARGR